MSVGCYLGACIIGNTADSGQWKLLNSYILRLSNNTVTPTVKNVVCLRYVLTLVTGDHRKRYKKE